MMYLIYEKYNIHITYILIKKIVTWNHSLNNYFLFVLITDSQISS